MSAYIKNNLVYPRCAREKALEGVVTVSFFVLSDGSIYRARVEQGMDEACDRAALRFVENMPKWTPAKKNGAAVASKVKMEINFQLEI